jgi:hypothetical protein
MPKLRGGQKASLKQAGEKLKDTARKKRPG